MAARTGATSFADRLRKTEPAPCGEARRCCGSTRCHHASGARRAPRTPWPACSTASTTIPEECLIPDPETGEAINISHMIPAFDAKISSAAYRGLARISEATVGLMGRTPDYMNVKFACFAARRSDVGRRRTGGNEEGRARTWSAFQRRLAARGHLPHAHDHPPHHRQGRPDGRIVGNRVPLHKVGETAHGIVVRGRGSSPRSRPSPTRSQFIRVCPCPADAHAYALAFAIPVDTPGSSSSCRDSASAPARIRSTGRCPPASTSRTPSSSSTTSRCPRERLFHRTGSIDLYNAIRNTGVVENLTNQTTIRAADQARVRLRPRHAHGRGDQRPESRPPRRCLASSSSYLEVARSAVLLSAEHGREVVDGMLVSRPRPLCAHAVAPRRRGFRASRRSSRSSAATTCWPRRAGGSSITPGSARSSTNSFTAPTGWTRRRAPVFSGWPGTSWDPGSAAGTSSTSTSISPRQAAIELPRTPPTLIAPGPTRSSTAFWPQEQPPAGSRGFAAREVRG